MNENEIIGNISITKGRAEPYRQVYSNSSWFNDAEYFIIEDDGECLVIKKCYLEIPKKAMKLTSGKNFQFRSDLPLGKFEFDKEESNEDELVIYYT